MLRKIRNKMAKGEPILQQIGQIYTKDIYAESSSDPSSRQARTQAEKFVDRQNDDNDLNNPGQNDTELQAYHPWDSQMMWNYFLVSDFYASVTRKKWVLPVIMGHIEQKNFIDGGNKFSVMVIARRSRHYAGTRYLRRGINHEGYVANWVEVEQIVERQNV